MARQQAEVMEDRFRVSSKGCPCVGVDDTVYWTRLNCCFEADPSDARGSFLLPWPAFLEDCERYVNPVKDGCRESQGPAVATLIGRNTNDPPTMMTEKVFKGDVEAGMLQRTLRVVDQILVRPLLDDRLLPGKSAELRYFPPTLVEGTEPGAPPRGGYQICVKKTWSEESTVVRLSAEKSNHVAQWQVVAQRVPEPDRMSRKRRQAEMSSTSSSGVCNPMLCQLLLNRD